MADFGGNYYSAFAATSQGVSNALKGFDPQERLKTQLLQTQIAGAQEELQYRVATADMRKSTLEAVLKKTQEESKSLTDLGDEIRVMQERTAGQVAAQKDQFTQALLDRIRKAAPNVPQDRALGFATAASDRIFQGAPEDEVMAALEQGITALSQQTQAAGYAPGTPIPAQAAIPPSRYVDPRIAEREAALRADFYRGRDDTTLQAGAQAIPGLSAPAQARPPSPINAGFLESLRAALQGPTPQAGPPGLFIPGEERRGLRR